MNSCSSLHPEVPEAELEVLSAECNNKPQKISRLIEPEFLENYCQQSPIGKKLPNALYVHISAVEKLDSYLRDYYAKFGEIIATGIEGANIIKFHTDQLKISFLFYPDFDTDPHPALRASIQVDLQNLEVQPVIGFRDYANSENPPILHRKETFVTSDYPHHEKFVQLTCQEEKLGLLHNTSSIG